MEFGTIIIVIICVIVLLVMYSMVVTSKYEGMIGNKTIIRFYSPTCSACVASTPEWKRFKSMYRGVVKEYNISDTSSETQELAKKYNITHVPTIIKIMGTGSGYVVHDGARTAENIMAFANS